MEAYTKFKSAQFWPKRSWSRAIMVLGILCFIVIGAIFIFIINKSAHQPPSPILYRDAQRINGLVKLRLALEMYADQHDLLYPPISSECSHVNALREYLVPVYFSEIPQDPLASQWHPVFEVGVSQDRTAYILKAVLEDTDFVSLKNDVDDYIFGCNCNDPAYCIP